MVTQNTKKKAPIGIQSLDMLGGTFKMNYKSMTGRFQTKVGGYLSIALGLAISALFVLIGSQYFNTSDPVVTTSSEFNSGSVEFNLYQEELLMPLALTVGGRLIFGDAIKRYATIKAQIHHFWFNNKTKNYIFNTIHDFDYVPCGQIDDPVVKKVFKEINSIAEQITDAVLCPDLKNFQNAYISEENPKNSSYTVPVIKVYPCSLPDPNMCASAQELSFTNLVQARMNKLFVPANKDNPVSVMPRIIGDVRFDSTQTKSHTYAVKANQIIDDTSYIGQPAVRREYATFHLDYIDTRARDPNQLHCAQTGIPNMPFYLSCFEYFTINFQATGRLTNIRRGYRKLTTVLGEFGGSMKLLTSFVFIAYSFYNFWRLRHYVANNLYNYDNCPENSLKKFVKKWNKKAKQSPYLKDKVVDPNTASKREKINLTPILKDCIEDRTNAIDLMAKLDFIEMLQRIMLNEDTMTLMPLLMMKFKKEDMELEKKKAEEKQRARSGKRKTSAHFKKGLFENNTRKKSFGLGEPEPGSEPDKSHVRSFEEAYNNLADLRSSNLFDQSIARFMREHVAEFFDESDVYDYKVSEKVGKSEESEEGSGTGGVIVKPKKKTIRPPPLEEVDERDYAKKKSKYEVQKMKPATEIKLDMEHEPSDNHGFEPLSELGSPLKVMKRMESMEVSPKNRRTDGRRSIISQFNPPRGRIIMSPKRKRNQRRSFKKNLMTQNRK